MNFLQFDWLDASERYTGDAGIELVLFQCQSVLATLADAAGLGQSMMPDETLAPASYCEPGLRLA